MFGSRMLLVAMMKNGFERSVTLKLIFLVRRYVMSSARESFQFFPGMKTYICSSGHKIVTVGLGSLAFFMIDSIANGHACILALQSRVFGW